MNVNISHCNNVDELMRALRLEHKPEDWLLFIEFSKSSLKAILHDRNDLLTVPVLMLCT
jgi:hypothetical protein